jgi:hypothetical protein
VDLLESVISGARKVVVAEIAHMPNLESSEEFDRLVLCLLEW